MGGHGSFHWKGPVSVRPEGNEGPQSQGYIFQANRKDWRPGSGVACPVRISQRDPVWPEPRERERGW